MFEQKPGEAIFVAESHRTDGGRFLNCYWPCGKSFSDFKRIVENNDREIVWEQRSGNQWQWGIARGRSFWFDPMYKGRVARAGVQINVTGLKYVDSFLKKIKDIASETIVEQAKLPPNLTGKLKKFVATS